MQLVYYMKHNINRAQYKQYTILESMYDRVYMYLRQWTNSTSWIYVDLTSSTQGNKL